MPDPLDPEKFHIMKESTKKKLYVALAFFVFLVFPFLMYVYYNIAINRPSPLDKELSFEIRQGEGVSQIAKELYQNGVVNSEFLFTFYLFINKLDSNIQAGVYTISAGTPLVKLIEQFQHGVNDAKITFIEGWRVEEYARAASKQFSKIDYSEFVKLAAPYEGYLFPDTYYFNTDIRETELLNRLRSSFENKTKNVLTPEAETKIGLTKPQIVIIASMVEREVRTDKDRKLVAGIIIKRFKSGMLLGVDATTQYAVAQKRLCGDSFQVTSVCTTTLEQIKAFDWWVPVEIADLEYDSPFNTRKNTGFPPAPISNPSLASISAVVNYENSDYLYYLTDKSGDTHYAKTLEEHNANVAKYIY